MVQNLSQTGNTSSPGANMLSFNTPSGLGIEGTTPAGLSLPTPGIGGASMVPTMSDLGLTARGGKRNEDEERRAKMRKVLKSIGRPKGRVSEESIARISRRVGFQNDIDVEKLTAEEKERKVGNRPISTAGNAVVIDFDLKNNVPQNVTISFTGESTGLKEQRERAGRVLLNDLKAPNGIALDAKLDRFAMNLERLARMDRLSLGGINCFAALSGIYTSLRRLYEQEILAAKAPSKEDAPDAKENASIQVTYKKSGNPLMHANGILGLEIMYWREGRKIVTNSKPPDTAMELDGQENKETQLAETEDDEGAFTLRIETEACPAGLYPPLRVSDAWLPEPLELPNTDSGEGIPWQDPPPTLIAANAGAGAIAVDGEQKLPDLRFVAKLDPPVVMPYQTALNVLSTVGAPTPQILTAPPSYAALLLDPSAGTHAQTPATTFTKITEQIVLSQKDGNETTVKHYYTLNSAKPTYADYGFKIHELPFSHPRRLIELLPTLRQWARIGLLLKATFGRSDPSHADNVATNGSDGSNTAHLTLDDLFTAPAGPYSGVPVDITLATSPIPTLGVTFPTLIDAQIGSVNVQILPNADIFVTNHEGVVLDDTMDAAEQGQRLARALDACGDLGIWIEWMRTRSTSS